MSGKVGIKADFIADIKPEGYQYAKRGRVLMTDSQLVLALGREKSITIDINAIQDARVGYVPDEFSEFFNDGIPLVFKQGEDTVNYAVIESTHDNIKKFGTLLFGKILNGVEGRFIHPYRTGGHLTNSDFEEMSLKIRADAVTFRTKSGEETVDIGALIGLSEEEMDINDHLQRVVKFQTHKQGTVATSVVRIEDARPRHFLIRYMQIRLGRLTRAVEDIELTDNEEDALVGIYSGGSSVDLAGVLGLEVDQVKSIMEELAETDLLENDGEGGYEATTVGKAYVNRRVEDLA